VAKIEEIRPYVDDPDIEARLEALRVDADELETRIRDGDLPDEVAQRRALDELAGRLRAIGESDPQVGAILGTAKALSPAEIDAFRDRLRQLGRRPGHSAAGRQAIDAFDSLLARTDLPPAEVRQQMAAIENHVVYQRPLSRSEIRASVDMGDPAVRAEFEAAMRQTELEGNADWQEYGTAIIEAYENMPVLEIGRSPRTTDKGNVAGTDLMRARFLDAKAAGNAHPSATAAFDRHMALMRAQHGSDAAAVAKGDAIWVDPVTGAPLKAPQPGAVAWPNDAHGVWRVDHVVELQHGGADVVSNYFPVTQTMHGVKSSAMNRFGAAVTQSETVSF
jgi:hypothetical protein